MHLTLLLALVLLVFPPLPSVLAQVMTSEIPTPEYDSTFPHLEDERLFRELCESRQVHLVSHAIERHPYLQEVSRNEWEQTLPSSLERQIADRLEKSGFVLVASDQTHDAVLEVRMGIRIREVGEKKTRHKSHIPGKKLPGVPTSHIHTVPPHSEWLYEADARLLTPRVEAETDPFWLTGHSLPACCVPYCGFSHCYEGADAGRNQTDAVSYLAEELVKDLKKSCREIRAKNPKSAVR